MVIELHLSCMKSERWNSVEDDLSKICLAIVELTLNLEFYFKILIMIQMISRKARIINITR